MKKAGMQLFLATILLLTTSFTAAASIKDVFVSQDGKPVPVPSALSPCSKTQPISWLASVSNWGTGAAQVGPGTTIHLCGPITGAVNTSALVLRTSGAAGNPITVKAETGSSLSSPAWSKYGAINLNGQSYIVLDGNNVGMVQNTANGSGLTYQQVSNLISNASSMGSRSHDIIIKNWKLLNAYQYVVNSTLDEAIYSSSNSISLASMGSNIQVVGNTIIRSGKTGIEINPSTASSSVAPSTNWEVAYNDVSRSCWFVDLSAGSPNIAFSFASVHHNKFHDNSDFWNTDNSCHADPVFIRAPGAGASYSDVYIYDNDFFGPLGNMTGIIFFSQYGGKHNFVFNNLFRPSSTSTVPGRQCASNGWIAAVWPIAEISSFNNTFDASQVPSCQGTIRGGSAVYGQTVAATIGVWKNNIEVSLLGTRMAAGGILTSDYNDWFGINIVLNSGSQAFKAGNVYYTFAKWQGIGQDIHSIISNPNLDPTGRPGPGSPVIQKGVNLTSECSSNPKLVPLCLTKDGVQRSSTWSMGIY
jgi:hypothetical protein